MRQLRVAEFIYILNEYTGYIWNFTEYLTEWYRRDQINELWQIYMAKCVSIGIDRMPDYATLLRQAKGVEIKNESPEEVIARLRAKIEKSNGGVE